MSPREGQTATPGEILDAPAKSEAQLRAFIDQVPALAWSALPDGSSEFLNEQCRAYTGLSSQELCGSGWEAAVHADDMERMREWWATLLQRGTPGETEIRFRRFDGVYRWFLVRALPAFDEQHCVVAWYGNNTDIEDLKRAEEKLKLRETELQQIVEIAGSQSATTHYWINRAPRSAGMQRESTSTSGRRLRKDCGTRMSLCVMKSIARRCSRKS